MEAFLVPVLAAEADFPLFLASVLAALLPAGCEELRPDDFPAEFDFPFEPDILADDTDPMPDLAPLDDLPVVLESLPPLAPPLLLFDADFVEPGVLAGADLLAIFDPTLDALPDVFDDAAEALLFDPDFPVVDLAELPDLVAVVFAAPVEGLPLTAGVFEALGKGLLLAEEVFDEPAEEPPDCLFEPVSAAFATAFTVPAAAPTAAP